MLDNTQAVVAIAVGLVTLAAAGWAFRTKILPWYERVQADYIKGRDALVGREAVKDSITGRELSPALPGIGQRMANVETAIVAIAQQQQEIADLKVTVAVHDREIGTLGDDVQLLKQGYAERIVAGSERTQMWRAVGNIARDPDHIEDEGRGDK